MSCLYKLGAGGVRTGRTGSTAGLVRRRFAGVSSTVLRKIAVFEIDFGRCVSVGQ